MAQSDVKQLARNIMYWNTQLSKIDRQLDDVIQSGTLFRKATFTAARRRVLDAVYRQGVVCDVFEHINAIKMLDKISHKFTCELIKCNIWHSMIPVCFVLAEILMHRGFNASVVAGYARVVGTNESFWHCWVCSDGIDIDIVSIVNDIIYPKLSKITLLRQFPKMCVRIDLDDIEDSQILMRNLKDFDAYRTHGFDGYAECTIDDPINVAAFRALRDSYLHDADAKTSVSGDAPINESNIYNTYDG